MSENLFHAGAIALFVALCVAAGHDSVRANATAAAAERAALIAAQQAASANGRLAQASAGPARPAQ